MGVKETKSEACCSISTVVGNPSVTGVDRRMEALERIISCTPILSYGGASRPMTELDVRL